MADANADCMETVEAYSMSSVPKTSSSYALLLEEANIPFQYDYPYLLFGAESTDGWVLHLSAIRSQVRELLHLVVPFLSNKKISFRVPVGPDAAGSILDGQLGWELLGKIVSVYLEREKLIPVANELILLTRTFRGPAIPSASPLGSVVFADYSATRNNGNVPSWPFTQIRSAPAVRKNSLLHNRYKPVALLKPNVKGQVLKAIYFRTRFSIGACLLKEGKENMYSDTAGRDITDRLRWQYDLHKKLQDDVPVPKAFELFQENGSTWLAMEFIRGISLDQFITETTGGHAWVSLPYHKKRTLLDKLLDTASILEKLHQQGIIHRDVTPDNFLVDKKGKTHLIDLELAYSVTESRPNPPFGLGTEGFMSPEQLDSQTPTVKEDIFGLGATMIAIFTGLPPARFLTDPVDDLEEQLIYFIHEKPLVSLIMSCIHPDPARRPVLAEIRSSILQLRLTGTIPEPKTQRISEKQLKSLIESALIGLGSDLFLDGDLLWKSRPAGENSPYGNPQKTYSLSADFYTGIPGILHVIELASRLGYNVSTLSGLIARAHEFLQKPESGENKSSSRQVIDYPNGKDILPGKPNALGDRAVPIVLNLVRVFEKTGQKKYRRRAENLLRRFPPRMVNTDFTLGCGLAGLGEACMEVARVSGSREWEERTAWIAGFFSHTMQVAPDGGCYWITGNTGLQTAGLMDGQAGIIHFLLRYAHPGKL